MWCESHGTQKHIGLTEFRIVYVKECGKYPYAHMILDIMTSLIPVVFNGMSCNTGRIVAILAGLYTSYVLWGEEIRF